MERADSPNAIRGDTSLPPVASSPRGSKRPHVSASDVTQLPVKKPRHHGSCEPFDLDLITLACTTAASSSITALNLLAEPGFTGGEFRNPHHYQYSQFRRWLLDTVQVPEDCAVHVVLPKRDGENRLHSVHDRWSFGSLLCWIRYGILAVPFCVDYGYILKFDTEGAALADTPLLLAEGTADEASDQMLPVAHQPFVSASPEAVGTSARHEDVAVPPPPPPPQSYGPVQPPVGIGLTAADDDGREHDYEIDVTVRVDDEAA